jgi:hypothetical protein
LATIELHGNQTFNANGCTNVLSVSDRSRVIDLTPMQSGTSGTVTVTDLSYYSHSGLPIATSCTNGSQCF